MRKIVINKCFGGFGLSDEAVIRYGELAGINIIHADEGHKLFYVGNPEDKEYFMVYDIPRDDAALIKVVEEMGAAANDVFSELVVIEIPDDVEWMIEEYDGREWVSEKHRTWS